jgi:hypothetical protein
MRLPPQVHVLYGGRFQNLDLSLTHDVTEFLLDRGKPRRQERSRRTRWRREYHSALLRRRGEPLVPRHDRRRCFHETFEILGPRERGVFSMPS